MPIKFGIYVKGQREMFKPKEALAFTPKREVTKRPDTALFNWEKVLKEQALEAAQYEIFGKEKE